MQRTVLTFFLCVGFITLTTAQTKLYFGLAPSYSYSHFSNGTMNLPVFDDGAKPCCNTNTRLVNGFSNQEGILAVTDVREIFARKFAYMLTIEHIFTAHHSLISGAEYGSRRFAIVADNEPPFGGTSLRVTRSFRSMGVPLLYQYSYVISKNWRLQAHIGGSINQSHSTEQGNSSYLVHESNKIFPLAIGGIGIQKRITNSFSLKGAITYHHGFFNVLDEVYREEYDNRKYHTAGVESNGSHFKFSLFIELIHFGKEVE